MDIRLNPSNKILIGLLSGIAVGLFFGESAAILKWVADGFVRLLQMTVLPYVTVSIISSLGSLQLSEAKRLGLRVGAVLGILTLLGLAFAFLFPVAFPETRTGSFFSTTLLEQQQPFNFLDLYIPSNPFYSLANNIVPAVVLFSLIVGIALIGIEQKQALLNQLSVASSAISSAARMIIKLTPYGLFAIGAVLAGTLRIEQLQKIQIYLVTYAVVVALLTFWVLPALLSTLTGIPYLEIFKSSRGALITAFAIGDLFIVLPGLIESSKSLLLQHTDAGERNAGLPDAIVPVSFNLPHTGKILSLSFILFAGWASDAAVAWQNYPKLALMGVLTFFGSLNSAIPFLLDFFRIPADSFQLFLATGVINSRFGTLLAAVHTLTVGVLGSAALAGVLRFKPVRILRYCLLTAIFAIMTFGSLQLLFSTFMKAEYQGAQMFRDMGPILFKEDAQVLSQIPPPEEESELKQTVLEKIRSRGALRLCFLGNRVPYVFYNDQKKLSGFTVELGHSMGRDLGVSVEFVETNLMTDLPELLARGQCDMGISGIPVTPLRASSMLFSEPYMDETLAFIVKDHLRHQVETWEQVRSIKSIKVAIPDLPYYIEQVARRAPSLKLHVFSPDSYYSEVMNQFDAIILPAERGSIYTLLYPDFTVVVPQPDLIKLPLAYPVARRDLEWLNFVNTWIQLKKKDGTIDALYRYWILGENPQETHPRWSIIRNVLHWVK
jgi:Na+/H+-dicarboxylate symporter/ABC-type amino acid transport substrate-binding protein